VSGQRKGTIYNQKGSTLIEMIVCFALLSLFVTSASMIIASTTNLYHRVKGETNAKQITDIVMEKILYEIEGAKYDDSYELWTGDNPAVSDDWKSISLYDKTDTGVTLKAAEGELIVEYAAINNTVDSSKSREATVWKFDKKMYGMYSVDELYFVPGPQIYNASAKISDIADYGIGDLSSLIYKNNIVVVFMKVSHPRYGTYRLYRPIKMYYLPEDVSNP